MFMSSKTQWPRYYIYYPRVTARTRRLSSRLDERLVRICALIFVFVLLDLTINYSLFIAIHLPSLNLLFYIRFNRFNQIINVYPSNLIISLCKKTTYIIKYGVLLSMQLKPLYGFNLITCKVVVLISIFTQHIYSLFQQ